MTRSPWFRYVGQHLFLGGLTVVALFFFTMPFGTPTVHALPEYANYTGEPCATCHVSPGGGGPRTLRGMLWAAQGRPQQVPILKGVLIAPGVNDPQVLYDTACAACHGASGEGLLGVALFGSGLSANKVRNAVLRGKERSGMPSFEGQFSNSQLEILVEYVAAIGAGQINPPASYSLPQGELRCGDILEPAIACGGN